MSPWIPRVVIALAVIGVGYGIYSIAVGEGGPQSQRIGGVNEVQRLLGGIPQDGGYLGSDEAETTVTIFNDLQCEGCADWQLEQVNPLIDEYARGDRVRFEFRHFASGAKAVTLGAVAAEAAGLQSRQWQYVDTFLRNQDAAGGRIDDDFLRDIAEAVPELEIEEWEDDLDGEEATALVEADEDLALELELPGSEIGTSSAPLQEYGASVVVAGPGGQRQLEGFPSREQIDAAVAEVSG